MHGKVNAQKIISKHRILHALFRESLRPDIYKIYTEIIRIRSMIAHARQSPAVPAFRMIAEMHPFIYDHIYYLHAGIYNVYTGMQLDMLLAWFLLLFCTHLG